MKFKAKTRHNPNKTRTTLQTEEVMVVIVRSYDTHWGEWRKSRLKMCTREVEGMDNQTFDLDLENVSDATLSTAWLFVLLVHDQL